jgi:hypothetical protein
MVINFSAVATRMRAMWESPKQFAPYAAIELILPRGTVRVLLCWLDRRRRVASGRMAHECNLC